MLTIRKFLRTLIGVATPAQILLACVLGSLLGFLPVTNGGTVMAVLLALLLLVLNANLFLAGLVAAATKILSILTAPLAFTLGVFLIEGPTRPLAELLANGPVTAWLGFDSYLAVGGLTLGLIVGLALGFLVTILLQRLRRLLGGLEEGSAAFRAVMDRRLVKAAAWVLFGGVPKGGFAAQARRKGLPIRISGVVIAIGFVALLTVAGWMLADGAARRFLVAGLTRVNGATVEIEDLRIAWLEGRAEVRGLAVCDPEALERDLFAAESLAASLDLGAVLRRRLAIDLVSVSKARIDTPRRTPGRLDAAESEEQEETSMDDASSPPVPDGGNLEEYLRTAREWRDRLRQIARVVEDLADRIPAEGSGDGTATDPEAAGPDFETWLRSQIDLHGYAGVRATHLLVESPRLLVRRVEALGVRRGVAELPTYDVVVESFSTEPRLVAEAPSVGLTSSDDSVEAMLSLGGLAEIPGDNEFEVQVRRLPADRIVRQLVRRDDPPFSGGSIDARIAGTATLRPRIAIQAPLEVVLREATIRIRGEQATIPQLAVLIDVQGALGDPRITVNERALADSLRAAGAGALASRAEEEANSQVDRGLDNLERKTGIEVPEDLRRGIGDAIGGGLDGLFGGGSKKKD